MDSLDLLAREDEFKRLNKELEKKSESLMKQIEKAMQKQDIFAEFSHSLTLSPAHNYTNMKKHCCEPPKTKTPEPTPTKKISRPKSSSKNKNNPKENNSDQNSCVKVCQCCANNCTNDIKNANDCANNVKNANDCTNNVKNANDCTNNKCASICTNGDSDGEELMKNACDCFTMSKKVLMQGDLGFLYAFVSVSVEEEVLPKSFLKDRATVESVCKFLSSKVKLMRDQIKQLQTTLDKKAAQCESHLSTLSDLESERLMMNTNMNNLRSTTAQLKAKLMAAQKRLEEKERLYKEQRTEADKLSSETKRLRARNASVEARCASQEQTIDNLKHQIELAKRAEKELRDSTRALTASNTNTIKELERRIAVLSARASKQAALIDNLRRQKALLTADGAVSGIEREFRELLMA